MSLSDRLRAAAGRAFLGAGAGAALAFILACLLAEPVFSYHPPDDGFGPLLLATGAAALAGGFVGVVAGGREVRGPARDAVLGLLTGALCGALAAVYYGKVAAAVYDPESAGDGKAEAVYRLVGLLFGVPAGSLLGAAVGLVTGLVRWRRAPSR
jgi:hypothetical protein